MAIRKRQQVDSIVTFENCRGSKVSGTLIRLSRDAIVFEVYNPYSVVQSSEVLDNVRILRGDRAIYQGQAVVTSIVGTGLMLIVEASLVGAWSDLAGLSPGPALREEVDNFIGTWSELHQNLRPDYINAVTACRNFLLELSRWLEHGETVSGLRDESASKGLRQEFAADVESVAFPKLFELFARFEEVASGMRRRETVTHRAFAQRELHPLMLCSPYIHRTFTKPLGYAGDYQMVNMILCEPLQGESVFAKVINALPLRVDTAQAHRNRISRLTDVIEAEAQAASRKGKPLKVLNVGCGPAIEVQRFVAQSDLSDRVHFTLVDFNEETLEATRRKLDETIRAHARRCQVECVHRSIDEVLRAAAKQQPVFTDEYHLVYCAGLFDYLSDLVCSSLVDMFYGLTSPAGLMLVTNVHTRHPSRAFMEHLLEWNLVLRDEVGMEQLGSEPMPKRIYCESTGTNVFLEARRSGEP